MYPRSRITSLLKIFLPCVECSWKPPLLSILTHMNPVYKFLSYFRSVLILSSHLPLDLQRHLHSLLHVHSFPPFITRKLHVMHFSSPSYYFLPLCSTYSFHLVLSSCLNAKGNVSPIKLFITYWYLWRDDRTFVSFIWRQKALITLNRSSHNGTVYYSLYCNKSWRRVLW